MKYVFLILLIFITSCTKLLPVKPIGNFSDQQGDCQLDADDIIVAGTPEYPAKLLHINQEGWVVLKFDLVEGIPTNIKVLDSSPEGLFEESAINSLKKSRYKKNLSLTGCLRRNKFEFHD